jgi:hypothetical protein
MYLLDVGWQCNLNSLLCDFLIGLHPLQLVKVRSEAVNFRVKPFNLYVLTHFLQ